MSEKADFGIVGMAVMGKNLALNVLDHGYSVRGYNREPEMLSGAIEASGGRLLGAATYEELIAGLARPRRILMMIKAGAPVDMVLDALLPLLEPGDVVIDGGNSFYQDSQRREAKAREIGVAFVGMGVSGGEEGARRGPSLMPGGSAEAYAILAPVLEAIAAKTEAGPCVTHVGPDGAGHFVKMVHNGIEYADMQLIAEAYDLLARVGGLDAPRLAEVFASYDEGPLQSFLVQISARIFREPDGEGGWLVDRVLDKAGQKGTGRWTEQVALDLGVPVPSIAAAITARVLSSMKADRSRAAGILAAPDTRTPAASDLVADLERALEAAKIIAYAQGMALIAGGSREHGWGIDLAEMARIWKGGCIIRARFLDTIRGAFEQDPTLDNLMLAPAVAPRLVEVTGALRRVTVAALSAGIAVPGLSASLAYYDSYRSARLPQNLTQAQRDAFGAHTYQLESDPEGPARHTDWLA
ncbi:MAG: NADP-dependent phosphogluconate dehydrogenase [Myxococcales bacterium]|nr:NADP-dependent phosphogluconate dehydrogenase [Myxococcales bacterium]